MIARRLSRGGDIQPVFLQTRLHGFKDLGMAGHAEIIAPRKVGKFAVLKAHIRAIHLLQRW